MLWRGASLVVLEDWLESVVVDTVERERTNGPCRENNGGTLTFEGVSGGTSLVSACRSGWTKSNSIAACRSFLRSEKTSISLRTSFDALRSFQSDLRLSIYLIYKGECLSVCLFAMHLSIVRASAAKLSRNPLLIQEKVVGYFFPGNFKSSPPPKDPPSVSNRWNCSIPFSNEGPVTIGFRGCWVRIYARSGWNPIGWLRTNRNSYFEKSLDLN